MCVLAGFLVAMSVADLGICVSYSFPAIGSSVTGTWPFGDVACAIHFIVVHTSFIISMLSMTAVNIDRYVSVEHPLKHLTIFTVKKARIFIVTSFCLSCLFYTFIGWKSDWSVWFIQHHHRCVFGIPLTWLRITYYTVDFALMLVSIIIVMVIYVRMMVISRSQNPHGIRTNIAAHPSIRRKKKSSITYFYVAMSMMIGYFPYYIVAITQVITGTSIPSYVVAGTRVSYASTGWWNVLIYYKRNKSLRKTFNQLVYNVVSKIRM